MFMYIDADACPVKEEVYRVVCRYAIKVYVVANMPLRVPAEALVELIVVRGGFNAADDWIVERVVLGDIVITADILLADRCLSKVPVYWAPRASRSPKTRSAMPSPLGPSSRCSGSRGEWRRPCPVRQGGPLAVPVQTRRDRSRRPPRLIDLDLSSHSIDLAFDRDRADVSCIS